MGRIKAPTSDHTVPKQKPAHLFKPGQSGNPAGRPVGSKSRLTENILFDLAEFYEKEGKDLIRRVRDENPAALLQGLLKLIPKDISLNVSGGVELELTVDQRTRIAEAWLMGQSDRLDAIEGEAVRVAVLPETLPDEEGDQDDLDAPPDRESEPVSKRSSNAGVHRQARRPVHSKIISSRANRDD